MDTEQRANHARQLRDDPMFREIMDELREEAINVWAKTATEQQGQREFAWMMVRVIDRIGTKLQSIVDDQFISARAIVREPD